MITKFKIFESVSTNPKVGDYVLINNEKYTWSKELENYFALNLGQITEHVGDGHHFDVVFTNFSEEVKKDMLEGNFRYYETLKNLKKTFSILEFKYWSSNKEDLEILINAEKYNL